MILRLASLLKPACDEKWQSHMQGEGLDKFFFHFSQVQSSISSKKEFYTHQYTAQNKNDSTLRIFHNYTGCLKTLCPVCATAVEEL